MDQQQRIHDELLKPVVIEEKEYVSFTTTLARPKFILFGDSITEQGVAPSGWHTLLGNAYVRRVDIINRGLGGYNTRWGLDLIQMIINEFQSTDVKLITIAFGANDASLPDSRCKRQFVPVSEYQSNIKKMVHLLKKSFKDVAIILITPPPVNDKVRDARTLQNAGVYATACKETATELNVPVVDTWTDMQRFENWETNLLSDGLHLTSKGNEVFYCLLQQVINANFPNLRIQHIPRQHCDHKILGEE